MRAVAQLIWLYCAATPLQLGLLVLGIVCMALGLTGYLYYPTWSLGTGMRSSPLLYQGLVLLAPWLGLILLFLASARLPAIVERLALGRSILMLPGGRARIVLSAVITAALLALLTAAAGTLSFYYYPNELKPDRVFSRIFAVTFTNVSVMYAAYWIVGKARGIWLLLGALLLAFGVLSPLALIGRPVGVSPLVWVGALAWIAFAALLLGGSRLKHGLPGRAARTVAQAWRHRRPAMRYAPGRELELLLGTSRPWVIAIGQMVPIAVVWWIPVSNVLLLYMAMFGAISGAVTSTAAARSRSLWLLFGWPRGEIFERVEAEFWRYNAYALGVLLLLFVAVGSYRDFSTPVLALGISLLVVTGVASSYLGLLMTRSLRWRETAAGILTMGLIIAAGASVTDASVSRGTALVAALAGLALAYRNIARRRWLALDWMLARGTG